MRDTSFLAEVDMRLGDHQVEVDHRGNFHQMVVDKGCTQNLKNFLDPEDCMMMLLMEGICCLELLLPHYIQHEVAG